MGRRWESAIFRHPGDGSLRDLARSASGLLPAARDPIKVLLHFMLGNGSTYVSSELTAFSRRPLPPRPEAVSDLARIVLGDSSSLSFESSDILLAQELSRALADRCLYVHASDTYSSAGYVLFSGGEVERFEVLGWQGSDIYRSGDGRNRPESGFDEIVARGWSTIGEGEVQSVDDLFDLFYSDESEVISFLLMEKREKVWPPQQLPS